ncbi:hypothetical protein CUMW_159120 [Citrus unshiu]|uniref:Uncharacterized protein n=1 Tax=Citrus unshiu TaxID=55188 RepID=A0A2H5PQW6_CITUN|nr:hypothetical protein CUMW_159120 [Citrus unshiu]
MDVYAKRFDSASSQTSNCNGTPSLILHVDDLMDSLLEGYAVGGGHVLHMVCDLTIAADNAIFGQTGVKHVKGAENLHSVLLKSVPFDLKDLVNCKDHGLWIGKSKLDETCSEEPNVTLVKVDGAKPMTLVSWKIKTGGIDQGIDMLLVIGRPNTRLVQDNVFIPHMDSHVLAIKNLKSEANAQANLAVNLASNIGHSQNPTHSVNA